MDLKELLGEELYNQVQEKAEDNKIAVVSDGSYIPKEKFDSVNNEKNDYKQQLVDRDTQLDDLKKKAKGNEDLLEEIDRWKQKNEEDKNAYEQKLQENTFSYELEKALSAQKAKNPTAVKSLLKTDAIKLDGDKLLGLEEQLTALKESDSYLFEEDKAPALGGRNPVVTSKGNQATGMTKEEFQKMGYQDRVKLYQDDPDTYKQLNN